MLLDQDPPVGAFDVPETCTTAPVEDEYDVALPAVLVAVTAHLYSYPADEKAAGKV